MSDWEPSAGGWVLRSTEGEALASVSLDVETGRHVVWAGGEYLGSSPDPEGAKELAERVLGAEETDMQHDTTKLPTCDVATEAAPVEPDKPKRQRRPRSDKGQPRARKAKGNGESEVLAKAQRILEIDAQRAALAVERTEIAESLTRTERDTLAALGAIANASNTD